MNVVSLCKFCIRTADEKRPIQLFIAYADKHMLHFVCLVSRVMWWVLFFFYIRMVYSIVVTGLVCSAILKRLSKKANNVKEQILSKELEEHSMYGWFFYIPILLKFVVLLINEINFFFQLQLPIIHYFNFDNIFTRKKCFWRNVSKILVNNS